MDVEFSGHASRECGEHRPEGARAWCAQCAGWCSPTEPCRGCRVPQLQAEMERLRAELARAQAQARAGTLVTTARRGVVVGLELACRVADRTLPLSVREKNYCALATASDRLDFEWGTDVYVRARRAEGAGSVA